MSFILISQLKIIKQKIYFHLIKFVWGFIIIDWHKMKKKTPMGFIFRNWLINDNKIALKNIFSIHTYLVALSMYPHRINKFSMRFILKSW
jgi:hypothetical protein